MEHARKFVTKNLLVVLTLIASGVFLFIMCDLWATHVRLESLAQAWEADGPQATVTGRLRAHLAALTWLGPLRPDALLDPYTECGIPPAGDGWWSVLQRLAAARGRLACLEDHMAEARAEHSRFVARLCGLCFRPAFVLACVVTLIAKAPAAPVVAREEEEQGAARPSGPSQPPSGRSSVRKRLKKAIKAALFRSRRRLAKKRMGYGIMDWWRKADDGRGKLVEQPEEPVGDPNPPRLFDPCEELPRLTPSPILQQQHLCDVQCPCAGPSRWEVLLQVVNLLLLAYLCLSGGAAR